MTPGGPRKKYAIPKQPLQIGKVMLTPDVYLDVQGYLAEGDVPQKDRWEMLITQGIRTARRNDAVAALIDVVRDIRRVTLAMGGIDTEEHPMPQGVDPLWWQEQSQERTLEAHRQLTEGVRTLTQLSHQAGKLADKLREVSK